MLVIGAILTPGPRTVCAVVRTMGLSEEAQYQNYHRVLNRAVWSGLTVSQILPLVQNEKVSGLVGWLVG